MNNATDLIAKLLANEDLTVVQASVPTASFNIKTRILTLPIWKEASTDLIGMLVGHEVGHALYTTDEYAKHDMIETEYAHVFQGYLNILEDVRIEKLMKRKYPGIRKTFMLGYTELNERDFFQVKGKDFNDMLLIDKINLYFKAGYNCGVTFNKKEKTYVDRTERTETIQEVITLAKEIFEYTKDEVEEAIEKLQQEQEQGGENSESGYSDEDLDDSTGYTESNPADEDEDESFESSAQQYSNGNKRSDDMDELLEAKTETSYQKKINELADVNTEYTYYKPGKFLYNPLVSYKEVAEHCKNKMASYEAYEQYKMTPEKKSKVDQLKSNSIPVVNYLIKEFEMKKAATAYKRTTVSKTGQLDMRKIYSYKLQDDLFKRMSTIKNGKNHGMIFLLDWSGSMHNCINQTLDQVINLAMFCRSAQIPFQVMAFTDSFKTESYSNTRDARQQQEPGRLDVNTDYLALLEFFNHKMSSSEFNEMVSTIKTFGRYIYSLSGTPLNSSLNYMLEHVGKFKKQYNVEKLTFITLTDGQGETLGVTDSYNLREGNNRDGKTYVNFLLDDVTGKSYSINRYYAETYTNAFLAMIKERYDATTLGFYLTSTSYGSLGSAINYNCSNVQNKELMIDRMKKEIKHNGYASLKGAGRDELFIVPLQGKIEDGSIDDIKTTGSSASIARQFGKLLNKRKTSRVLLSKFINYVA